MGHLIFLVIHVACVLFIGLIFLLITVPLHLIYAAITGRPTEKKPNAWTHVKCPDCKELVLKEANICKHCGCKLIPQ